MPTAVPLVSLHAAVALFGFAALFGKWIDWDPVAIVLGRTVVAAVALAAWLRWRRTPMLRPSVALALSGAILAVHWYAFFAAIAVSSVTTGLLGYASFPLFVLVLERRHRRRQWRSIDLATAVMVVAGLALTVREFTFGNADVHGLAWGVVSGFAFAWLVVRTRVYATDTRASSLALWLNVFATLCLLPFVLATGGTGGAVDARSLGLILLLGVVCTALAHTLFIVGIAGAGALTAAVVAALEPVYGIALAWGLLGEVPGLRTAIGAALLVAAAIVASMRPQGVAIP